MLEMIDVGVDNAVAFRISGKLTAADMKLVLDDANEKINSHGTIVILEQIDSFRGIEIGAIVEEFRFLADVGMSNISRTALLADSKWLNMIVSIEDKIFKNIEMKYFSVEDKASAIAFLTSG